MTTVLDNVPPKAIPSPLMIHQPNDQSLTGPRSQVLDGHAAEGGPLEVRESLPAGQERRGPHVAPPHQQLRLLLLHQVVPLPRQSAGWKVRIMII
jgi:hypothetical protein